MTYTYECDGFQDCGGVYRFYEKTLKRRFPNQIKAIQEAKRLGKKSIIWYNDEFDLAMKKISWK